MASGGTGAAAAAIRPIDSNCLTTSPTGWRMALAISRTDTPAFTTMTSMSGSDTSNSGGECLLRHVGRVLSVGNILLRLLRKEHGAKGLGITGIQP